MASRPRDKCGGLFFDVLLRSINGFRYLAGGGSWWRVLLVIFVIWVFMFGLFMPVVWTFGWAVHEKLQEGSLSPTLPPVTDCAFATLVTGRSYVRGARVLAHTLQMHLAMPYPLVALTVGLKKEEEDALRQVGWDVRQVEPIPFVPQGADPNKWTWKPEARLGEAHVQALTKMRVWELPFKRVVFIDSDAWALGDCSILCRRTEGLAAMGSPSSDVNSGVMSLRPDQDMFNRMMDFWKNHPEKLFLYHKRGRQPRELPNPDQSLIIGFFGHNHLPIGPLQTRYNLNGRVAPDEKTRILHFNVDIVKPWGVSKELATKYWKESIDAQDISTASVWRNVLDWISLEEKVNKVYGD